MKTLLKTMRYNLIWYIPLSIWIFFYFILQDIIQGFGNIKIAIAHLTWGVLISPSAYIFFTATIASVWIPFAVIRLIPSLFDHEKTSYKKRYLLTIVTIVGMILTLILLQIIIWGSFPLGVDSKGYEHLRMIPFIPLPDKPMF